MKEKDEKVHEVNEKIDAYLQDFIDGKISKDEYNSLMSGALQEKTQILNAFEKDFSEKTQKDTTPKGIFLSYTVIVGILFVALGVLVLAFVFKRKKS